jgi:hypothetical protein
VEDDEVVVEDPPGKIAVIFSEMSGVSLVLDGS